MKRIITIHDIFEMNEGQVLQYSYRNMRIECVKEKHLYKVYSYDSLVGLIDITNTMPEKRFWEGNGRYFVYSELIERCWRADAAFCGGNGATTAKQITMLCRKLELYKIKVKETTIETLLN